LNAVEISLLCVVALLVILVVLVAVLFSRALQRTLDHAETMHSRNAAQLDGVLDRFMAVDFASFKGFQAAENAEEGAWEPPDEEQEAEERPFATTLTENEELASSHSLSGRRL
jgi:hypothetical protein